MGILHPDQHNTTTVGGVGYGEHPGVAAGTHIPATETTATGPAPNTAGPHRHDILNKLDPSVDSDLSKNAAAAGTTTHTTHGVNANTTHHNRHGVSPAVAAGVGAGVGGGVAHHHNHHNNGVGHTHGTHTAAPSAAYNNGGLGTVGAGGVGHHNHTAVPVTGGSAATGPAPNTAGPHKSDMVNRLDPTVDSHTGLRK